MKLFGHYIKPLIPRITLGFTIKVAGTIMDLLLPWILSYIIDDLAPYKDKCAIIIWGVIMLLCSIIAVVFNITANRMASYVASCCTERIRHDLFAKITYLDAVKVDEFTLSSLESRLTSDTYYVHQMVGLVQRLGVRAPILLIGGITVTLLLDAKLSLIMLCTMPFIAFTIFYFSSKGVPLYTKLQQAIDKLTAVVRENATGIRIIKALCKTDHEKKRFDKVNKEAIASEKKAGITMAATNPLITFFLNIGLTAVIVVGAHLVYGDESGTGKIIAFMSYFSIISSAMLNVSRLFITISKGSAGMNRIEKVLVSELSLFVSDSAQNDNNTVTADKNTPHIKYNKVDFSYQTTKVLSDISFSINHGETLGIIGATGSGKSTLISLLLRTYDVDSGSIEIDGTDIRKMSSKALRSRFGVVFQNDFLFADTIRENVSFCREMSDDNVNRALKDAQAYEFVSKYTNGFNEKLEIKGANISGGQKQRLLIARAFAANPEVLILDDCSSALDYKTDAALSHTIANKYADITKIIIAQRVSSIIHADKIIMLDAGRIIGMGTHEELIESCAEYRETSISQIGGGALE